VSRRGRIVVAAAILAAVALGVQGGLLAGATAAERRRARRSMGVA